MPNENSEIEWSVTQDDRIALTLKSHDGREECFFITRDVIEGLRDFFTQWLENFNYYGV